MQLTREGDVYRCGTLALVPDPPEDVLVRLFYEWRRTGVLDLLWYGEPINLTFFLNWFTRPHTNTLGCYSVIEERYTPLGLCWINATIPLGKFKRAEVGMGYVRKASPRDLLTIGQLCVEWGFRERGLDVICGTTPAQNPAAVHYGKRLGFRVAGPIGGLVVWHGNLEDGYFQSMTKDEWVAFSPFQEDNEPMGVSSGSLSQYASKQGYAGDDKINNPFAHPLEGSVVADTEDIFGYKEDFTGQAIEPTPEEAAKLSNVGQVPDE